MGTVPAVGSYTAGQPLTAAQMNAISTALNFLLNPPTAEAYGSAAQSIPTAVATAVTLDTNIYNTDSGWTASSPTRLTCNTAGSYQVFGQGSFASNATGLREAYFRINGSTAIAQCLGSQGAQVSSYGVQPIVYHFNVGDYVELMVYQSSGGALNTYPNSLATFGGIRMVSNQ